MTTIVVGVLPGVGRGVGRGVGALGNGLTASGVAEPAAPATTTPTSATADTAVGVGKATGGVWVGRGVTVGSGLGVHAETNSPRTINLVKNRKRILLNK